MNGPVLLGRAAWPGWPRPWCDCGSCRAAGRLGGLPPTAVLLDSLLVDPPGPGWAGGSTRVTDLVLTGAAPASAAAWLLEAHPGPPPRLAGAAGALPERGRVLAAGDRVTCAGHEVVALPGTASLALAVDGTTLIAPTGTDPELAAGAAAGRGFGWAVVGCPDARTCLHWVAALRRAGALAPGARVQAAWAGHANPAPAELAAVLAAAGVAWDSAPPPRPARVVVTGGCRSGKSAHAELLLAGEPEVVYVATGAPPGPRDPEWAARVAAHRRRRPAGWTTVETTDPVPLLAEGGPPLLLDGVGTWLAAHLEDPAAAERLVAAFAGCPRAVVAVTDEVGAGVHPSTRLGRSFRDQLGRLNARLAQAADEVWLVTVGIPQRLR